eukprot:comp20933_c0_seq2/m.43686 comp20933_c0_seq2/g.43686  ORF comp20933_c0_seq2/g.43686 comp20933_c0_seq2/m.43686 type:complete len:584 (-) comp20933_c0_seq2:65-1816(-)
MLSIVGHCRVCLVEIGSEGKLVPACATKATEGLSVKTHSPAVVESVRHNLQFLTCRHPNVCATCEANGNCEFQRLSYRFGVHELLPGVLHNPRSKVLDTSSNSLVRDMDKCVLCSRCIRACSEIQGMNILGMAGRGDRERVTTVDDLPISATACISCGQCTAVCPVGALIEKPAVHEVHDLLANADGDLVLVAQTAPAVRVAISEEFGLPPGTASTGKMVAALKQLGFHYVFDTNFSADVTIMEEATEFVKRLTTPGSTMPMFTSCCPGWINLVEKTYPKLMPHLSTCKSPQGMLSSIIKHVWAKKNNINPEKIRIVSIMPCVAKKDEAARPQLRSTYKQPDGSEINTPDTDYVLTTRELGHLIQNERIPFATLPDVNYDTPFGESTGAAALFAATGGVMEAALRTANFMVTGKDLEQVELHAVRGLASGLANIRETTVDVGGIKLNMAVVTGTRNVRKVVEDVLAGTSKYHLIEVMACPGGCVGGGGEPKTSAIDKDIVKKRIEGIWRVDGGSHKRMSHHNQSVKELYTNDLKDVPLGSTAHHLLHTHYSDRTEEVLGRWDDAPPGAPPPVTHDEAEKNAKH